MEARRARDLDAAEPQRPARPERVRVVPDPGSPGRVARPSSAAARSRSAGTVTLRLAGSPGTTWTAILQASSRAASSVHVPSAADGTLASASRRSARRTPCGVWAAASVARSTVASTRSPSTALERLGDRARPGSRRRAVRSRRPRPRRASAATSGRAPSWTSTTRRPARVRARGLERGEARPGPSPGDAAPPVDERRSGRRAPSRRPRARRRRSAVVTTTIDADARGRPPARRRRGRAAADRRSSTSSLSAPPIRGRRAGGDDDRVGASARADARAHQRRDLNRDAAARRSSGRPRSGGRA